MRRAEWETERDSLPPRTASASSMPCPYCYIISQIRYLLCHKVPRGIQRRSASSIFKA